MNQIARRSKVTPETKSHVRINRFVVLELLTQHYISRVLTNYLSTSNSTCCLNRLNSHQQRTSMTASQCSTVVLKLL